MAQHGLDYQEELEIIQQHLNFDQSTSSNIPEWQTYPEIPTARDLNPDYDNPQDLLRIHSVLPNTWDEPWRDRNTYLETHYRLMREEAVSMLRYSVRTYRGNPTMNDDDETCIYTRVYVRGYLMTRLGPMCRIQFSTERAGKKIRWTQTRRLNTGSLVVISTAEDNFKTICMPAVIADHPIRDGLDQNPPTIQIFWSNTNDFILDPAVELVMLESRIGYFEAVRHCMVGLQHVANVTTPLDKYLVSLDKSDLPAQYVRENPQMNLGSLVHHIPGSSTMDADAVRQSMAQTRDSLRNCQVLNGINDHLSPYTNLDNSQLSAVHRILTKELAIIQGPPGTGKTFTSVQALQILLESQPERGSNAIIVAAQTNHAVDQILIQLIKLGFNTVRLGGRTQNEEIKRYNMFNLRRHAMPPRAQMLDRDYKTLEAARKRTIARLEEVVKSTFPGDMMDPQALQAAGLITQKQLESLQAEDGWGCASSADEPSDLLSQWLGDQRVAAPSMDSRDPDFDVQESDDTVDVDVEDYDMELDDCIADDDEDRGRVEGRWVPIKHQWTGANPRQYTEHDLVIRKELNRDNLWDVGKPYRGAIYQYWQREMLRLRRAEFRDALAANARICKNLKANRWHKDLRCMRIAQIEIIGCTTTGLCKYRGLLAALKPRTMLIEEAAETKEANILSALYPSLQQLILVGDHQQLAPSCDTPFLDLPPYFIRVSMFERLIKLHMPYTMLNMQRRMNPVLREVLNPFYPQLQDHPVVKQPDARPPVPGMAVQSWFFDHTWSEGTDENLSKYNILEANMVVQFINYLLLNGTKSTEITVLTFYRGQRKKILGEFRKLQNREHFTNVHTVDSYQGEENDIVVLSLVRSNGPNGPHRAGFLKDSNRGVVSISRARRGFYIFGNMTNLEKACQESMEMWCKVQNIFLRQGRFDERFPITCQQHNMTTWVEHPDEFVNNHGGCREPCPEKLECGHDCGRNCHWLEHSWLICQNPCERFLRCGHRCQKLCGYECECNCSSFTGAYPTDEAWDDDTVREDSSAFQVSSAPFVGSDGRVGRVRGNRYASRGGRGNFVRGNRPAQTSGRAAAQGSPTRLYNMTGQEWANFDARQHDAQRREAYYQSAGMGSSNPLQPSAHADEDMINPIRDTFRQVTLNHRGTRNVREGVVSEKSGTPSPEKVATETETEPLNDVNLPRGARDAGDLLDLTQRPQGESTESFIDPFAHDREQVDASTPRHSDASNEQPPFNEAGQAHFPQQRNTFPTDQYINQHIRGHDPGAMANASRAHTEEDRPEWEYSDTVCDSREGNADTYDAYDGSDLVGEDLIDL
ncbi:P-loop containing nucleoside triphosphate hydrolase protein [Xylariaceae sp. AK1471]|nr:P-loop containing nucleoside triphosphate hydrolase protein [Xylariaceae sp. AK1471]